MSSVNLERRALMQRALNVQAMPHYPQSFEESETDRSCLWCGRRLQGSAEYCNEACEYAMHELSEYMHERNT